MTRRIGEVVVIEPEEDRPCEMCGRMEECRPAGLKGEQVCFDCGQKNPEAMGAYMNRLLGPAVVH